MGNHVKNIRSLATSFSRKAGLSNPPAEKSTQDVFEPRQKARGIVFIAVEFSERSKPLPVDIPSFDDGEPVKLPRKLVGQFFMEGEGEAFTGGFGMSAAEVTDVWPMQGERRFGFAV